MSPRGFAFRREPADDPEARIWLLDRGGEVLAGCRTRPTTGADDDLGPRAAEVLDLAVAPGLTGHGLGARLLGHAVNDLLVRGRAPIFAWVAADAGDLIGFYARHGFRPDGSPARSSRIRVVRRA
jgi:ribosomal protein S18 acetylase RimI-like enzyme